MKLKPNSYELSQEEEEDSDLATARCAPPVHTGKTAAELRSIMEKKSVQKKNSAGQNEKREESKSSQ
jgi:hypothetical protein